MKALLAPLAELADYEEIRKNRTKENGMIQISGCVNTQKIHLLSGIGSGCGYKLVVFSNEEKAKKAYEEYLLFGEETYLYPARDLLFYYADIKGKTLTNRRMEVLRAIAEKKKEEPVTVITTMDAFLDGIISPDEIQKNRIHITGEDTVDLTKLEQDLTALGYERESHDPEHKVSLLMDHTRRPGDVADPWYTGHFEATWQDVLEGCTALPEELH